MISLSIIQNNFQFSNSCRNILENASYLFHKQFTNNSQCLLANLSSQLRISNTCMFIYTIGWRHIKQFVLFCNLTMMYRLNSVEPEEWQTMGLVCIKFSGKCERTGIITLLLYRHKRVPKSSCDIHKQCFVFCLLNKQLRS